MPDQEMIDRVAEGLRQHFKDTVSKSAEIPFEETKVSIPAKVIWDEYAKAAIKAMLEPTQKMMDVAIRKGVDCGFGCSYPEYEDVYKATISSILND